MTRHRPYRPQTAQISADIIRVDTCDTRRCMNPLTGIWPHAQPFRATDMHPLSGEHDTRTSVHCSFYKFFIIWSLYWSETLEISFLSYRVSKLTQVSSGSTTTTSVMTLIPPLLPLFLLLTASLILCFPPPKSMPVLGLSINSCCNASRSSAKEW